MLADLVKETSTTIGTGNFTLAGAVTGFRTFNTGFGTNTPFPYKIDHGAAWEIGDGYLSDATTLVRQTVRLSSNSNELVDFGAGTKTVFNFEPAHSRAPLGTVLALRAAMP